MENQESFNKNVIREIGYFFERLLKSVEDIDSNGVQVKMVNAWFDEKESETRATVRIEAFDKVDEQEIVIIRIEEELKEEVEIYEAIQSFTIDELKEFFAEIEQDEITMERYKIKCQILFTKALARIFELN